MNKLIEFAKKKPSWLPNEGYWRILQILRLIPAAPLAAAGVLAVPIALLQIFVNEDMDDFIFASFSSIGLLLSSIAMFFVIHGIAWTLVWVKAGFTEAKRQ